jgi:alpha-tubulin suppressor-like RCC1 family protein
MKNIYSVISKIIVILVVVQLTINGSSCHKRKNKAIASQSSAGYIINAPSNLSAILTPPYQADLSWIDNSNNEDGFEIWRSVDSTNYAPLYTLNADVVSYSDTSLLASTTYCYRVRAFNNIGDKSAYSNAVSITTPGEWSLISAGADHVIALKIDGSLWAWGRNDWFQLGLGDTDNRNIPYQISSETDWQRINAGYYHSVSLKSNGSLWGWGRNYEGQLGFGTTLYDGDFIYQIGTESDWSMIAGGFNHTLSVKINRTLWATGFNEKGQLGLNDTNPCSNFTQIGTLSDWINVTAGNEYSSAIKENNTVWTWGSNNTGQLGLGHTNNRSSPCSVGTDSDWNNLSSGDSHTIALKTDSRIWTWGNNTSGQLGLSDYTNRTTPSLLNSATDWQMISAGGFHSLAIKTNGTLFSWGRNNKGQLGLGISSNRNTPCQIGTESTWVKVAGGGYHTVALKNDGSIWTWGENNYYQLGLGDTDNRYSPTQSGINPDIPPITPANLSAILISPSRIDLYWQDKSNNETGFKIERKIDVAGSWIQIANPNANVISYSDTTFSGLTSCYYRIKSFNDFGESAYSNESYIIISGGWLNISAGYEHTIALRSTNTLWSWGKNNKGQLGLGNTANRNSPTQIGIYSAWAIIGTGGYHTLAIRTNNTLWSWGFNDKGQLGIGTTADKTTPVQIGSNSDWISISGGNAHSLSIKTDGSLWAWGNNNWGQLGIGSTSNKLTPIQIGSLSDWSIISAGYDHSLGLKTDPAGGGTIWSWGDNSFGQLGIGLSGSNYNRTTPVKLVTESDWINISAGGYHSMARKSNSTIWSWGFNLYGQLGLGNTNPISTPSQIGTDSDWQIITGYYTHTLGIKNNILYAWGRNDNGQLGLGDTINRPTPTQINSSTDWSIIKTGMYHTITLKIPNGIPYGSSGIIWAWGDNQSGQLGLGDNLDRNTPTLNNY